LQILPGDPMVYVCPRCKRVFRSHRAYILHILIGHGKATGTTLRKRRVRRSRRRRK